MKTVVLQKTRLLLYSDVRNTGHGNCGFTEEKTRLPQYSDVRNTGHENCGFTEDKTPSIQRCEEHGT